MKTIETIVHLVGRFAVGLGIGIALVSAVVIVTTDIGGETRRSKEPAGIIRLDPVILTPALARTANEAVSGG